MKVGQARCFEHGVFFVFEHSLRFRKICLILTLELPSGHGLTHDLKHPGPHMYKELFLLEEVRPLGASRQDVNDLEPSINPLQVVKSVIVQRTHYAVD